MENRKRFLLFIGSNAYPPRGGAYDLAGEYNIIREAIDACGKDRDIWANIFDLDTMEIVRAFSHGTWNNYKGGIL